MQLRWVCFYCNRATATPATYPYRPTEAGEPSVRTYSPVHEQERESPQTVGAPGPRPSDRDVSIQEAKRVSSSDGEAGP